MALTPELKAQIVEANDKNVIINYLQKSLDKAEIIALITGNIGENALLDMVKDNMTADQIKLLVDGKLTGEQIITLLQKNNTTMLSLINAHNPYTNNEVNDMSIFIGNAEPNNTEKNSIDQVELEVDGPYAMAMEWNFKGSPQKINKTIRLKYRYRAKELDTQQRRHLLPPHWVTAYLLIGYEDGGA